MRKAVIDIGTNSIKCLIADLNAGHIIPVLDIIRTTRLGADLHKSAIISPSSMQRSFEAIRELKELCNLYQAEKIICVGAMTLRLASNAEEFIHRVKTEMGLDIIVLLGDKEAELSFLAAAELAEYDSDEIMVIDIGGGSTEIAIGTKKQVTRVKSLCLGAVSLTTKLLHSDPPSPQELGSLQKQIQETLEKHYPDPKSYPGIGCGGTLTSLAAVFHSLNSYNAQIVHGTMLSREEIRRQIDIYMSRNLEERKHIQGLDPQRADIIIAGTAIIYGIMEHFSRSDITVSDRGLRHGALIKSALGQL
ncbi:MAG: Ppx/GppA phosphatase family protein [Candidatus Cloacimonadaceae bacterium]|nr:Ppx/GppA phosphatase family protein [Candidatus Cloacimonadaceae bacterium]